MVLYLELIRSLLDPFSGVPHYYWDVGVRPLEIKGLIVNGLVQGIGPCTFETNWEIAQFRVSPAPDQSPASEVRLRKSGFPRIVGSGSP